MQAMDTGLIFSPSEDRFYVLVVDGTSARDEGPAVARLVLIGLEDQSEVRRVACQLLEALSLALGLELGGPRELVAGELRERLEGIHTPPSSRPRIRAPREPQEIRAL